MSNELHMASAKVPLESRPSNLCLRPTASPRLRGLRIPYALVTSLLMTCFGSFSTPAQDLLESAEQHYNSGLASHKKGDFQNALAEFREAVRLNPNDVEARVHIGVVLMDENEVDDAIKQLHAAIQLDPDHAVGHLNLGLALMRKDDLENAIAEFRKAIQIRPD